MKASFFSVIVPVYNVEKYLHQCVDSILRQNFEDFELILVDDGSPDNCPAICDAYAAKDSRVKVIHKPNGGVSSARNAGLDMASSEFILFCDSDDYYLSGAFEKIANMIKVVDADVYCFGVRKELKDGSVDIVSKEYEGAITDDLLLSLAYAGFVKFDKATVDVSLFNKIYKKRIIDDTKIRFDETLRIAEDISFNVPYFAKCETIFCLSETLYFYRMNMGSAIHADKGFAEKGMERSVYFLNRIQRTLEYRIPIERLYSVARIRYNRLVIDACCNQHKRKYSFIKMLRFVKNCCKWYNQYLLQYNVELSSGCVDGKKARLEDFMIRHQCIVMLYFYTKIVYLYHS